MSEVPLYGGHGSLEVRETPQPRTLNAKPNVQVGLSLEATAVKAGLVLSQSAVRQSQGCRRARISHGERDPSTLNATPKVQVTVLGLSLEASEGTDLCIEVINKPQTVSK